MKRHTPSSTRTDTLVPYTTPFRSEGYMRRDFLLPPGPTRGAVAKLFIRGADDIGTGRGRRAPASEIARAQGARRAGFRDHRIDAVRRADIGFDTAPPADAVEIVEQQVGAARDRKSVV